MLCFGWRAHFSRHFRNTQNAWGFVTFNIWLLLQDSLHWRFRQSMINDVFYTHLTDSRFTLISLTTWWGAGESRDILFEGVSELCSFPLFSFPSHNLLSLSSSSFAFCRSNFFLSWCPFSSSSFLLLSHSSLSSLSLSSCFCSFSRLSSSKRRNWFRFSCSCFAFSITAMASEWIWLCSSFVREAGGTKDGLTERSGTTGPFWVKSVADPFRLCLGSSETWTEGFLARSN